MFVPQAGASNITLSNIKLDCGLSKGLCGVAFRRNNRHCIVNGGIIINARHNPNNNSEGARIGGGSALLLEDGVTGSDPKQNIISNLIVENCYQV
ncbi:hypothetical protein [Agarilytica rhodophyticola]|uniref:hypothetical protein n=1 Tax=Agarilytica rhodophyticola TaxID=1737490 RepID=UPI000B3486CF|nr:hypothetical protein [Agarilytica rhodophyticola]